MKQVSRNPESLFGRMQLRLLVLVAALVCVGVGGGRVSAQVLPLLAPPVTTPELMEYAELLNASPQQRLRMMDAHQEYLARFDAFEQRDSKKMLDEMIDLGMEFMANGFQIPPRQELEGLVSDFRRLWDKSRSVDDTLFDAFVPILAEDQLVDLERIRRYREMSIYQEIVSEMASELNRGASVNMVAIVNQMELSPSEEEAVDLILREYESGVLNDTRKIFSLLIDATKDVLDAIDELGLREMTPEEMMQFGQDERNQMDLMSRFDEGSKPFQETAYDISQRNLRTLRQIVQVLDERKVEQIRHLYYRRAYRREYGGEMEWRRCFRYAARFEVLTDAQRTQIEEQMTAFRAEEDAMIDPVIREVEESREYRRAAQFAGMDDSGSVREIVEELQERRENLNANAIAALRSIVGEELLVQISEAAPEIATDGYMRRVINNRPNAQVAAARNEAWSSQWNSWELRETVGSNREFGPYVIGAGAIDDLADELGLDTANRSIVMSLYNDYRESYTTLRKTELSTSDDEGNTLKPATQASNRRERFNQLQALDGEFFTNVELVLMSDAAIATLAEHRAARLRHTTDQMATAMAYMWGQNESYIDVNDLLAEIELEESDAQVMQPILAQHRSAVMDLSVKRLESAWDSDRLSVTIQAMSNSDGRVRQRMNERVEEAYSVVREISARMTDVNRSVVRELVDAVSPDAGWSIRLAYNRVAYPDVYAEQEVVESFFDRSLALDDLRPSQRDDLMEIRDDYRQKYFDISERIVKIREQRDPENFTRGGFPPRELIERELEGERLRFRREESSSRALARLKLVLTEGQLQKVPELLR